MDKSLYGGWALSLIALICADKRIPPVARLSEISCVIRHDGHYQESFDDGDSPAEAWEAEVQAIADSQ